MMTGKKTSFLRLKLTYWYFLIGEILTKRTALSSTSRKEKFLELTKVINVVSGTIGSLFLHLKFPMLCSLGVTICILNSSLIKPGLIPRIPCTEYSSSRARKLRHSRPVITILCHWRLPKSVEEV